MHQKVFGDWCELNFTNGVPDAALVDLRQDYEHIGMTDEARSAKIARQAGIADCRAVTFIPSAIVQHAFWKRF
jgi:hypothetical protein